jgi:hypothetical protein
MRANISASSFSRARETDLPPKPSSIDRQASAT